MRLEEIIRVPATDMDQRRIRDGIRICRNVPHKPIGRIGNVTVSMGRDGKELFYLFVQDRLAQGFAILYAATVAGIAGFFVTEIGLLDPLRFQGIGWQFYHLLLDQGMTLFSGGTQTPDSERTWRKLLADPSIHMQMGDVDDPASKLDPKTTDPWSKDDYRLIASKQAINEGQSLQPYLRGRCYEFALALAEKFPHAQFVALGDSRNSAHVGLRDGNTFYDARGAMTEDEFRAHHVDEPLIPISREQVAVQCGLANVPPPYRGIPEIKQARQAVRQVFG